jgi:hypothetical protein
VTVNIQLSSLYRYKKTRAGGFSAGPDMDKLVNDEEIREGYQEQIRVQLAEPRQYRGVTDRHAELMKVLDTAAWTALPAKPRKMNGIVRYTNDDRLKELSEKQQMITARIWSKNGNPTTRNSNKLTKLKRRRAQLYRKIKKRMRELEVQHYEFIADNIERDFATSSTRAAYENVRKMAKSKHQKLTLQDAEGIELRHDRLKKRELTRYYQKCFSNDDAIAVMEWRGDARPLDVAITTAEVGRAAARLKNHRAVGHDQMKGEAIKYGGEKCHEAIADLFNMIFETHETVPELKTGHLYPMNKPLKPPIVEQTRPLVFLIALRKVLSTIVLYRIMPAVERFVALTQHAYRARRSTTEIIMNLQWIRSTMEAYDERARIIGLDLSKAYDCLDRIKLIDMLREYGLATEDDLRIITFLLAETTLRVKVNGTLGEIFQTLIGTPQGDALSCILFIIYMEVILRTYTGIEKYMKIGQNEQTLAYADDVQLYLRETIAERKERLALQQHNEECACINCRADGLISTIPIHFAKYNMKVNPDKTTDDVIATNICTIGKVLGSEIAGEKELALRKRRAEVAFNAQLNIWKHKNVTEATKIKIFKVTVQCHYTQSGAGIVMKKRELDKLDCHQRNILRRLLGIFYPERIGNIELYKRAKTTPVSIQIKNARWKFIGHALRLDENTPLNKSMKEYYKTRQGTIPEPRRVKTRRGRLLTTIARILDKDLKELKYAKHHFGTDRLTEGCHLALLRYSAQNREHWTNATEYMKAEDHQKWIANAKERTAVRRIREIRAAQQQPVMQPDQQPALQAPIPAVLQMRRTRGIAPRPRGRPKGSKNKPK